MTLKPEDHIENALASLRAAATDLRVNLGNMNRHWLDKRKTPDERPLAKDLYEIESQIGKVESAIAEIKRTFNIDL